MKFLIKRKGIWVAVREDLNECTLAANIRACDVCVSDLDDCDAGSSARKIALKEWYFRLTDEKYEEWFYKTILGYLREGKKIESERWQDYVKRFLRDEKEVEKVVEMFDEEMIKNSLYPGVKEFYKLLPHQYKVYLTRNIQEVGEIYGGFLGFDEVKGKVFDKGKALEKFIEEHDFERYLIKEDNSEDGEEMLKVLESYRMMGRIKCYFSIYRTDKKRKLNPNFNANVGKNYEGLVEILKKV